MEKDTRPTQNVAATPCFLVQVKAVAMIVASESTGRVRRSENCLLTFLYYCSMIYTRKVPWMNEQSHTPAESPIEFDENILVRVPSKLKRDLQFQVLYDRENMSDVVRRLIQQYLDSKKAQ